jgi:hypothetical protein
MGSLPTVPLEHLSAQDRQDIDQQVGRILQHPLFHQSKRLPVFLRHIVTESLNGGTEGSTKERTLGVEVFGRKPDYDNNSDPIVRVTATELRKKLAQYYYEDGHSDEIRIELPPGTYLPKFRRSRSDDLAADSLAERQKLELEPAPPAAIEAAAAPAVLPIPVSKSFLNLFGISGGFLLLGVVVALLGQSIWAHFPSGLDRFWANFIGGSNRMLIVMPVIGSDNSKFQSSAPRGTSVSPNLSLEDTNIAVHIASQIERRRGHYQLVSSSEVGLDELRTGPSILIGALDNVWTMRLMKTLPFVFEEAPDHRTGRILDSTSPTSKAWTVNIDMPHERISHDYGILARFTNRMTGQPAIVVAGISSQGTQAAGELLRAPEFESIRSIAQGGNDFEVVIEVDAIDGHAGRPQVVASKVW